MDPSSNPTPNSNDHQTLQTVKSEAEKIAATVKKEAGETAAKVKQEAKTVVGNLKESGLRFAETQKTALSGKAGEIAGAVKALCTKLQESDEPNLLTGPALSAEAQLSKLSRFLQDASPAEVFEGVERLARRKPELFYGSLFLTGLVASRFLKASGSRAAERAIEESRKRLPRTEPMSGQPVPTYFNPSNV